MLQDTTPSDQVPDDPQLGLAGRPDAIEPGRIPSLPSASGSVPDPDSDDALAALYQWPARSGTPYVRANMIASLDGGASVDGRSAGLGNDADEHLFAVLRDLADVILVGSVTARVEAYGGVRLDDIRQARRLRWGLPGEPPPIAVVTGRGLDPLLPLFTDTVTPPIVITTELAANKVPDGIRAIISGHDRVNLGPAIAALGLAGFEHVHCEGGPNLLSALAVADLLDECCLTIAPMMLGSSVATLVPVVLRDPLSWDLSDARRGGQHLFTRYKRAQK